MAFTKILGPGIATDTNVQVGILTATKFYGDGSDLTGVSATGLGTALSQDQTSPLNKIYYTNPILSIGSTITIDAPSSTNVAYTQYSEISVEDGADLIVGDGDDFITDVLGISTEGATQLSGNGGRIRADDFTNRAGTGAPNFSQGISVTGIASISNTKTLGSSPFLQSVVAVEDVVYVEEDTTLTSPYATPSTLHTKNKIVSVNNTKILTVGDGEEFIIDILQL
jgi:hypothetical protein